MRRFVVTALLAGAVLLLAALPASAEVAASVQSPRAGQTITGPVGTQVRITRELLDPAVDPASVTVQLLRDGSATSAAGMACSAGCGGTDQTWVGPRIEPGSPDEFGVSRPLANGRWTVRAHWQAGDSRGFAEVAVTLSVPPSPVSGLQASARYRKVTVTWNRAPEPDITTYRIQRRLQGHDWTTVGSTDASGTSYEESTPSPGTYEYRVITVRPDGKGGALTATSSSTSVEAANPAPRPASTSEGGSGSGGGAVGEPHDGSGGGGGDGTPSEGGTEGGGEGDGDGAEDGEAAGGEEATRRGSGRRVAAPPGVRQGRSLTRDIELLPEPQVAPEDERFFGEGEDFSEELEYGAADPVVPEDGGGFRRVSGGLQDFLVSRVDTRTLLTSVAGGLVLITLGLHGLRWLRATADD